ncbi:MAG: OsmC family protein [Cyclobacteriaceae bacterium]
MMNRLHEYKATITWKGNRGKGTVDYKEYDRYHEISIHGKPIISASSDSAFRGDASKYTPEDLLVSSLSGCHMLWYLHLCAVNGIVVAGYVDHAVGWMQESKDGSGQFTEVILNPEVIVTKKTMIEKAKGLHAEANKMCFIARSVNFPVHHNPKVNDNEQT